MKRLLKKFEKIMTAITFAEAGEFETAREMMRKQDGDATDLHGKEHELYLVARGL